MKETVYLINTSRGPVVDKKALQKALSEKWIAGECLDVFYHDPIDPDNPILRHPNVVCTPHIAGSTGKTIRIMGLIAAQNIINVLNGSP